MSYSKELFNQQAIEEAHFRIKNLVHKTPILTSTAINEIAGCSLFFKCENFQKIGAFKMRGGANAILQLTSEQKAKGVVTHSSGNHAQAVAKAAQLSNIPAYIVMPKTAPKVKVAAVEGYGGIISFCESTQNARVELADQIQKETGATFIHPYNNQHIILGQATVAKEIFEEHNNLDYLVAPIGGGGLLSGSILSSKSFAPKCKIIGVEPENANGAYLSVQAHQLVEHPKPVSVADGLLASLGELNFSIINKNVEAIYLVNEEEIISALKLIWERMKIIVEPSCAVPLAGILKHKEKFEGKKIAVVLTGGNVDFSVLAPLL